MKKHIFSLIILLMSFGFAAEIHINHLGYHPQANKWAVIPHGGADSFYVRDALSDKVVLRGALTKPALWNSSQEMVQKADFSKLTDEGLYIIEAVGESRSMAFRIRKDVYADAYQDIQRAFYLWRASTEIPEEHGGIFAREFGHPDDDLAYHEDLDKPKGATRDVSRGWYDAGDYGKYVVNAGMSVAMLQLFMYLHPDWTGDEILNIPESGNGIPDLFDEVRWEFDWLLKMQDDDGGVFFKVTPKNFSGNVMPADDPSVRFVIGKSTSSTLNFVAMTAQAYRRYKDIDPAFADTCLARAKLAWAWAKKNDKIPYTQGANSKLFKDVRTGGYGDNSFSDEFYWAAAELFLSTKDKKYKEELTGNFKVNTVGWNSVASLGIYSLALEAKSIDKDLGDSLAEVVLAKADAMLTEIEKSPMRLPNLSFYWGSNGAVASAAATLLVAHKLSDDLSYLKAAGEMADYFFGKNPLNRSYVTGIGYNYPRNPHARILIADKIPEPIPGYVVGGPNGSGGDGPLDRLINTGCASAKCYTDDTKSYASNEIAINWQAPLVLLIGAVEATLGENESLAKGEVFAPVVLAQSSAGLNVELEPQKDSYQIGDSVRVKVKESGDIKFKDWIGDLAGNSGDTSFEVTGDMWLKALGVEYEKSILKNRKFTDSINHWKSSPYNSKQDAYGDAKWGEDSSLQLKTYEIGKQLGQVYTAQHGLTLVKGVDYTIEVEAKSNNVRDLGIKLSDGTNLFAQRTAVLSARYYKYAYSFKAPRSSENVSLHLEVGLDTSTVNVKSTKLFATKKPLAEDELADGVLHAPTQRNLGAVIKGDYLHVNALFGDNLKLEIFDKQGRMLGQKHHISSTVALKELVPQKNMGILWVRVRNHSGQQVLPWVNK
ncbi:MAG: hypothetical protein GX801_04300 [Fibrobacter sp.]|nr:hypothetical protein [Fibrobacter sp.]